MYVGYSPSVQAILITWNVEIIQKEKAQTQQLFFHRYYFASLDLIWLYDLSPTMEVNWRAAFQWLKEIHLSSPAK